MVPLFFSHLKKSILCTHSEGLQFSRLSWWTFTIGLEIAMLYAVVWQAKHLEHLQASAFAFVFGLASLIVQQQTSPSPTCLAHCPLHHPFSRSHVLCSCTRTYTERTLLRCIAFLCVTIPKCDTYTNPSSASEHSYQK